MDFLFVQIVVADIDECLRSVNGWVFFDNLFKLGNYLFIFNTLVSDLPSSPETSSRACHHFHIQVRTLVLFYHLYDFLDIPESIAFRHFMLLLLPSECVFFEIAIFYLLAFVILYAEPTQDELDVTI